jgi:hypothetical protein
MLSQPLPNLAQPNKAISNCESQQQHQHQSSQQHQQQQQHAKLMRIKHNQLVVNQVDEKAPPPSVCLVMEENLRMRRAIGDVKFYTFLYYILWVEFFPLMRCGSILFLPLGSMQAVMTLTQWVHETKDQNGNVASLVDRMKESVQKHNSQQPEDVLKAIATQV